MERFFCGAAHNAFVHTFDAAGRECGFAFPAAAGRNLIPLIYSSILYIVIDLLLAAMRREHREPKDSTPPEKRYLFYPDVANPILIKKGFSPRECHVALKIFEGISNKEIAAQLFISESTVKKHIQNMFRKCGAADRQDFIIKYTEWVKQRNLPE